MSGAIVCGWSRRFATVGLMVSTPVVLAGCGHASTTVEVVNGCGGFADVLVVRPDEQRGHDPIEYVSIVPGDSMTFEVTVSPDAEVAIMVYGHDTQTVTTMISLADAAPGGTSTDGTTRRVVTISGSMCPDAISGP